MRKWLHSSLLEIAVKQSMASQQLPRDSKTIDISLGKFANCFATASWRFQTMNPPTPQELERVGHQTKHRIRRLLRARACQTPDKASKPTSNVSEPTCKAATRVEVSPARPKPTSLPPASSNRAMEPSNRTFKSNPRSFKGFLWGPQTPAIERQRLPQAGKTLSQQASKYYIKHHQNINMSFAKPSK